MELQQTLFADLRAIPKMPIEYMGTTHKSCGYTKTNPREWTKNEIEWVKDMLTQGYSLSEISESTGRSEASLSIKIKRLGKDERTYNREHIYEKYYYNSLFADCVKPETALDLYCGTKQFWKQYCDCVTNDKDKAITADYNEPAERLIHKLYYDGNSFDLIDLDPFGSAYECFDLAIKMARKALVITLGELGHKRFKRLDYVSRYYGIHSLEDFTAENIIAYIQQIGRRNKKELTVWDVKEWKNIARVYFLVNPIKINCWENSEV